MKTSKIVAQVTMEHAQYFNFPGNGPYGIGSSANEAIEDLEFLLAESGNDVELERYERSENELIAFELRLDRQSGDYSLDATTITVNCIKPEPIVYLDDDNLLDAIVVCTSDIHLLNISYELKEAIQLDLENAEFYFYAYLID